MADNTPVFADPAKAAREVGDGIKAAQEAAGRVGKMPHDPAEALKAASAFKMPTTSYRIPDIPFHSIRVPSMEERHEYESAATFLRGLASRVRSWREQLPPDAQPVIFAVLPTGMYINVSGFAAEGHNGVMIRGVFGATECIYLVHQNSLQLLCYIEKLEPESEKPRTIGFRIGEEDVEA